MEVADAVETRLDTDGAAATPPLLHIDELSVTFRARGGRDLAAVDAVSLGLERGESLGIVGESGSGKSMTALSVMRLLPESAAVSGQIRLEGRDLLSCSEAEMRRVRGDEVGMVFQDPMTGLNPVRRVGTMLRESIRRHRSVSRAQADEQAEAILRSVGIPSPRERLDAYPHQLSGGLRQRVMIALALVNDPKLVIADEPTTALDSTIQAQILDVLREQVSRSALVLITHDLGVASELCDRVAVMYAGRIVEHGPTAEVLRSPRHPYTVGLLEAAPDFAKRGRRMAPIPGAPPQLGQVPHGCPFRPRCERADDTCEQWPGLEERHDRLVACWYPHD